ncbi:MAG TPA: hypothetical protein VFX28_04395 [Methylomirabilota bacterium]|nr:hypothetical protein [Methylomirabilota bacterium]
MMRSLLAVAALAVLAACARHTLPYTPETAPEGVRLSAGYQVTAEQLRIELDTDGRRVQMASIVKPDGGEVRAQTFEAGPVPGDGYPVGVGVGVGGGTWGGRGGIGVGTGVSVGIPVGRPSVARNTFAVFPLADAGPPPWRLHVKLVGFDPAVILIGAPTPPR